MFCHKCGQQISDFAETCEYCGHKVKQNNVSSYSITNSSGNDLGVLDNYYYTEEDINSEIKQSF